MRLKTSAGGVAGVLDVEPAGWRNADSPPHAPARSHFLGAWESLSGPVCLGFPCVRSGHRGEATVDYSLGW